MKLATLKADPSKGPSRDGVLAVVNKELTSALPIPHICKTLQELLDEWSRLAPEVMKAYYTLEEGNARGQG